MLWVGYTPLISYILLLVSTVGFGVIIPFIVNPQIDRLTEEADQKRFEQNGMKWDYEEFQRWNTKYSILYSALQNLQATSLSNNSIAIGFNLRLLINQIDKELIEALRVSLVALSSNLIYEREEERFDLQKKWNVMNYSQLKSELKVVSDRWGSDFNIKKGQIFEIEGNIRKKKKHKELLVLSFLIIQSFGLLFSFIASHPS